MDITQIETRGRPMKYDFDGFSVGETRIFEKGNIRACIISYCLRRDMDKWKILTRTINGRVHVLRIK